jgi:hypothetical protein
VASVSPASGATNVATGSAVSVTFDQAMDPTTITTTTFSLHVGSPTGAVVSATGVNYNSSTNTATLIFAGPLTSQTTYFIVVSGGTTGVKKKDGTAMANDFVSSFTTA